MSKKRKKQRRSSSVRPSRSDRQPNPVTRSAEGDGVGPFSGDLWDALRQGARNVAGVRYQLVVTAHLLAESRRGALPFVEAIPEGYEDIDCVDQESRHWFIQVKEVGAGAGSFTAHSLAAVMSHAAQAAGDASRIVAVTDAQLGTQVVESGWDRPVSEIAGFDIESVVDALMRKGHTRAESEGLLARTHVVRLPWNTTPATTQSLSSCYSISPAVAAIVASRLVEDLTQVAADQRYAAFDRPGRRALNDLDALVERTLSVVDVEALDSAVRLGICEIADYTAEPAGDLREFLLGVDVVPSHIAADFDVIRPGPSHAVQSGLAGGRYVLIAGPSGSGKSAQMWRSARDIARGARIIRVNRVATDQDLRELVRYVELLEPTQTAPVVVCCDDLGRPRTARWPIAAARLLERPGVLLLGAVRQEDFTAELLRHGGELVTLSLDDTSATAIAEQLTFAGVSLALEVAEAVEKADGQLMEFVALLAVGKRMRAVLSSQAESLLDSDVEAAAEVARLVCAAHVLGVSIATSSLEEAILGDRSALTSALRRLQDEHIVTSADGLWWQGLHQRRSDVLTELLHEVPPPMLSETFAAVLLAVEPAALGWSLRRLTELFPGVSAHQVDAVEAAVSRCWTAADLAILLESLERADHTVTASSYIPVLERHRRPHVPLTTWSMFVCGHKLAGLKWGTEGDSILDELGRHVVACSNDLPERSKEYCVLAVNACGERLTSLSTTAPLKDAVRLLEVAAPYIELPSSDLLPLAERFVWPKEILSSEELSLHARLRAAAYFASAATSDFADAWGSVEERLRQAAQSHPEVISASVKEDGSMHATVELLAHPATKSIATRFPWDLEPPQKRRTDAVNDTAVELAMMVGECCPELEIVEVITVLASGDRYKLGDLEPGHKKLAWNARPRRDIVRINVGVQAAISRQAAAFSWSELVRLRTHAAVELQRLAREAPRRVGLNDHPGRRSRWLSDLEGTKALLTVLPRPPAESELNIGESAADWDSERDEEPLTGSLRSAADALSMVVPTDGGKLVPVGTGKQLRDAAQKLEEALTDTTALTTIEESDAYPGLQRDLNRMGDLLVTLAYNPKLAGRVKGKPHRLTEAVHALIQEASNVQLSGERQALEEAFESVSGAEIHQVDAEEPFVTSITGHQWLVTSPPDSWSAVESVGHNHKSGVVDVPVSVVCEVDGTLLPIAVRLSTMSPSGILPLTPDSVDYFASSLGRSTVTGSSLELIGAVTEEIISASWEEARRRLRPADWPSPADDPIGRLATARHLLEDARFHGEEWLTPMNNLAGRLESELDGVSERPISAELWGAVIFGSHDLPKDHALVHVSEAVMMAIQAELGRS